MTRLGSYSHSHSRIIDGEQQDIGGSDLLQLVHDVGGILLQHQGRNRHRYREKHHVTAPYINQVAYV
jgi:hypothetical protein